MASLGDQSYFDIRYVLYGVIGVALLVATGADLVGRLAVTGVRRAWPAARRALTPRRTGRAAIALVLVAAALLAVVQWSAELRIRTVGSRLQDFTGPSLYLAYYAQPGDAVLFSQPRSRAGDTAYPADYTKLADVSLAETPQESGSFYGTSRPAPDVRAALAGYSRVWFVSQCGFTPPSTADTGGPLGRLHHDFHRTRFHVFFGVCVALFVRNDGSP